MHAFCCLYPLYKPPLILTHLGNEPKQEHSKEKKPQAIAFLKTGFFQFPGAYT